MITVVILVRNEAENLISLLPTLGWADQVLVIDDESTDQTDAVCKRFKVQRLVRPLSGDYAAQRNYALSQVQQGWVLFLDADERLGALGVREIQKVLRENPQDIDGFVFRREDIFYGRSLHHGETGSVRLVRLGRVKAGTWIGNVHEVWSIKRTALLKEPILHYSHKTIHHLFASVTTYAHLRSRELFEQKRYWSLWEQTTYPIVKFLYTFILRLGFLDGWRGLVMSVAMTWHSWLVRWYLWETPWKRRSFTTTLLRYVAMVPWLLLPFGQLTRGSIVGISVYGFELFMMLTLVIAGIERWRRKKPIQWPAWTYILGVLTLSWLFSYLISLLSGLSLVGGLYWIRWCLYMGYGLVMWELVEHGGEFSIAGIMRYVGYGLLFSGLFQYLLFPDMRWLSLLGWDDHYYRMIGSLFDPNFFGLLAVLGAWWVLFKTRGWERRILFVVFVMAILATFSRTSMVVGAFLALLYGFRLKQIRMVAIMAVLAIGIFMLLPKPGGEGVNLWRSFSVVSRIESWGKGWEMFRTHPLVGIGFNQYPQFLQRAGAYGAPFHPSAPDNSWVFVLATTGLVGFIPFLILLYRWWMSESDFYSRGVLLAILIHSVTNNSFFYPWVLLWWWLVLLQNKQETSG